MAPGTGNPVRDGGRSGRSSPSRKRQPKGTRRGGQFAEQANAENDATLDDEDRDDAFIFPGDRRPYRPKFDRKLLTRVSEEQTDDGLIVVEEDLDGTRFHFLDDTLHRSDGPAIERTDGGTAWYDHGVPHRVDGPAFERKEYREWWVDGKLHRDDGPAIEVPGVYEEWWRHGRLHRTDGPAIIWWDEDQRRARKYPPAPMSWHRVGIEWWPVPKKLRMEWSRRRRREPSVEEGDGV